MLSCVSENLKAAAAHFPAESSMTGCKMNLIASGVTCVLNVGLFFSDFWNLFDVSQHVAAVKLYDIEPNIDQIKSLSTVFQYLYVNMFILK